MNPYTLNENDAGVVKGMIARGDRQSDIAAYFGVNAGRVSEINTGKVYSWVNAERSNLPAPGPYKLGDAA